MIYKNYLVNQELTGADALGFYLFIKNNNRVFKLF